MTWFHFKSFRYSKQKTYDLIFRFQFALKKCFVFLLGEINNKKWLSSFKVRNMHEISWLCSNQLLKFVWVILATFWLPSINHVWNVPKRKFSSNLVFEIFSWRMAKIVFTFKGRWRKEFENNFTFFLKSHVSDDQIQIVIQQ